MPLILLATSGPGLVDDQFQLDHAAGFDCYRFGFVADAEHDVPAGGNVEHEDTGSVGGLRGDDAAIFGTLNHHSVSWQARVRFSPFLDESPGHYLHNDLSLRLRSEKRATADEESQRH